MTPQPIGAAVEIHPDQENLMRSIHRGLVAVAMSAAALSACSGNPTRQDIGTVAGAVVGGVVGTALTGSTAGTVVGAGAGAYMGNRIGKDLERNR